MIERVVAAMWRALPAINRLLGWGSIACGMSLGIVADMGEAREAWWISVGLLLLYLADKLEGS